MYGQGDHRRTGPGTTSGVEELPDLCDELVVVLEDPRASCPAWWLRAQSFEQIHEDFPFLEAEDVREALLYAAAASEVTILPLQHGARGDS